MHPAAAKGRKYRLRVRARSSVPLSFSILQTCGGAEALKAARGKLDPEQTAVLARRR